MAPEQGAALREQLRALMPRFGFAQCLPEPGAGEQVGWTFEAASAEAPDTELVDALAHALGLTALAVLRYADAQRGRLRLLRLAGDDMQTAPLQALLRVGLHDEGAWLADLWRARTAASTVGRWLLSPGAPPLQDGACRQPPGLQLLRCARGRHPRHAGPLPRQPRRTPGQLQATNRCGTNCGSCLPALRRLVATIPEEVPA